MRKTQEARFISGSEELRVIRHVPSAISSLRLIAFPFLILSISHGQVLLGNFLFLFAAATDYLDGYFARRLGASSEFGARIDVTLDFLFICGMFVTFVVEGLYPSWVLLPIVFMFAQFMVTSILSKTLYDPLGKYYGSFLYGAIGLTMLISGQIARGAILVSIVFVTMVTLASRLLFLCIFREKP